MRSCLLLVLLLISSVLHAGTEEYNRAVSRLSSNPVAVVRTEIPQSIPGHEIISLETPFAQPQFSDEPLSRAMALLLKGRIVEKIQLVYTTYAQSPSFDQKGLNGQRLRNLYELSPGSFESPLTQWELVGQTGAHSPEEGQNYFHGFIITCRPAPSPALTHTELRFLDSLFFARKGDGSSTSTTHDSGSGKTGGKTGFKPKTVTMTDGTKITIDRDIPEDSLWRYMRPSGRGWSVIQARYGDSAHTVVVVTEMSETGYRQKRTWKLEEHKGDLTVGGDFTSLGNVPDSVVMSVLRRNYWNHTVFVCDVTGSMMPYTAQMFTWLPAALGNNRCSGFVFFNDGDNKSNGNKSIGKTGGIYSTKSTSFDSVCAVARITMQNGNGGDAQENDLEAMLYAIEKLSPAGDIVLIADNWGPPRDLELYKKLNRPVHIILCGALGGVNPDYLFLARMTGGTVHTLKDDITNLSEMQEGETVKVGFQTFLLSNDHFVPLENFRKW